MQQTGQICFNITHDSRALVGLNDDSELKAQWKKQAIVFARISSAQPYRIFCLGAGPGRISSRRGTGSTNCS